MPVSFLTLAAEEFNEAVAYYESEQLGLGERFREEVARSLTRIENFPLAYNSFTDRTRRCLVAKFPFGIIYRFDPENEKILVLAIAHLHRRPNYWVGRSE